MFDVLSDPAIDEFENAPPASGQAQHARCVRQERRGPESGDQLWLNRVIRLNAAPGAGLLAGCVQAMLAELAQTQGVRRFVAVLKRRNFRSAGLLHKLGFEPADAKLEARFRDKADERVLTRLAAAGPR